MKMEKVCFNRINGRKGNRYDDIYFSFLTFFYRKNNRVSSLLSLLSFVAEINFIFNFILLLLPLKGVGYEERKNAKMVVVIRTQCCCD